ncbi:MAG: hypothetical protein GY716_18820 [bacterium]|nr:hypothetical protein [bacterium]
MRAIFNLPLLAYRALRWNAFRGGWWSEYRARPPFDPDRVAGRPVDVIVTLVDHFEPARRFGEEAAAESVASWLEQYASRSRGVLDAEGHGPRHSWFYRSEYRNEACLEQLSAAAFDGHGEVELHLHHGHDTHETFSRKLADGAGWCNRFGALLTAEREPRRSFAYIAGNWALDNGAGDDAKSGCNTELRALRECGCYADFTFPALGSPAQPRRCNSIYYATDDERPKSYDRGTDVAVGGSPEGDLMLIQGPLTIDWSRGTFEGAALEAGAPPSPARLAAWLSSHVHVAGRPEWVFVKLHTHGMQSRSAVVGDAMTETWRAMVRQWNREPYRLHFATAREAYNMIKAAEAGHDGNPDRYRDFAIPPPANRKLSCNAPWKLLSYAADRVALEIEPREGPVRLRFAEGPLRSLEGRFARVDLETDGDTVKHLAVAGAGELTLVLRDGTRLCLPVEGLDSELKRARAAERS